MRVICRTNLDLDREEWPREMSAVPSVGDEIVSSVEHRGGFHLTLQVVRIQWKHVELGLGDHQWVPHVELHMTKFQCGLSPIYGPHVPPEERTAAIGSIKAFYDWYAPKVGRTTGSFI